MKPFWERSKKFALPIIFLILVFLVLWANGRISIPWRTGTLDSFSGAGKGGSEAAYLLSLSSDEGGTFLLQRSAEPLDNYLFSLRIQSKFWQAGAASSYAKAQIFLYDNDGVKLRIDISDENTIVVDSHKYAVKGGIDIDYIMACFEGAEDLSHLFNGTAGEEQATAQQRGNIE